MGFGIRLWPSVLRKTIPLVTPAQVHGIREVVFFLVFCVFICILVTPAQVHGIREVVRQQIEREKLAEKE